MAVHGPQGVAGAWRRPVRCADDATQGRSRAYARTIASTTATPINWAGVSRGPKGAAVSDATGRRYRPLGRSLPPRCDRGPPPRRPRHGGWRSDAGRSAARRKIARLCQVFLLQSLAVAHDQRALQDEHGDLAVQVGVRRALHPGGNALPRHEHFGGAAQLPRDAGLDAHAGSVRRPGQLRSARHANFRAHAGFSGGRLAAVRLARMVWPGPLGDESRGGRRAEIGREAAPKRNGCVGEGGSLGPAGGFEPSACCLRNSCSTTELHRPGDAIPSQTPTLPDPIRPLYRLRAWRPRLRRRRLQDAIRGSRRPAPAGLAPVGLCPEPDFRRDTTSAPTVPTRRAGIPAPGRAPPARRTPPAGRTARRAGA